MPRQKKSTNFEVPTNVGFLCHLIVERQRINKIRLSSTQNSNYVMDAVKEGRLSVSVATKLSKAYSEMYEDCKTTCKQFSALMSYVSRKCGVSMDWGTCHQVRHIKINKNYQIDAKEMQKQAQSYVMDEMLFPELKVTLPCDPAVIEKRYEALKSAEKQLKKQHKA